MTRARWAFVWIAAGAAFAAGVFWPLSVETELAYALSMPLVIPLGGLFVARPPGWFNRLNAQPDWLKVGVALIPLEGAMAYFVLSDGSFDAYFLVGLAGLAFVVLLLEPAFRDSEGNATGGGDADGSWGPPGGFDA